MMSPGEACTSPAGGGGGSGGGEGEAAKEAAQEEVAAPQAPEPRASHTLLGVLV